MKFELKLLKFGTTYGCTLASDEVTGFSIVVLGMLRALILSRK